MSAPVLLDLSQAGHCPGCAQLVAFDEHGLVERHPFAGDAPSYWLRPGEPCPGSAEDPDDADAGLLAPEVVAFDLERQLYAAERRLYAS